MFRLLLVLSLLTGSQVQPRQGVGTGGPVNATWQTGQKLESELNRPVIAVWQNTELHAVLKALREQHGVAIVLDRRLDSGYSVSLETNGASLRDTLGRLADAVGGFVSVTAHGVYIGPISIASKLRTLLSFRQDELQQAAGKMNATRKSAWTRSRFLKWDDVSSPSEIILELIQDRDPNLVLKGADRIPHDLWAAGELPALGLAEALTLILIQFDLTYQIDESGASLQIVPVPEKVTLERRFTLPKAKAAEITRIVQVEVPRIETQLTPEQLIAVGTQEQLDELERMIKSLSSGGGPSRKTDGPVPIGKRRITFQAKSVPLIAIIDKLGTTGIRFEFDQEKLNAAGIKLDQLVDIDVKDVKLTEMFDKLFAPVGLKYHVDGVKVELIAAP